jgi:hypothetical protein
MWKKGIQEKHSGKSGYCVLVVFLTSIEVFSKNKNKSENGK